LHYYQKVLWLIVISALCTGCGLQMQFSDTGPIGKLQKEKVNKTFSEGLAPAPAVFYDLETIAGSTFEGINKADWIVAEEGLTKLQSGWQQAKPYITDPEIVKKADEALNKLSTAVTEKQNTVSYEELNQFMSSIGSASKSYKLSPLSDIISVDNSIRDTKFYLEDNNWGKTSAKQKELETAWKQIKPSLEQFGIMGKVTKTHSYINQLKDAVQGENKGSAAAKLDDINTSMAQITAFYRGQ